MDSEIASRETLLYLEFNEKIPPEVLDDKIFIRVANLEDKNPLVQVNDMVFKGSYEYSVGTNLFFKKTQNQGENEFPFQQPMKYNLEFFKAQTKILNCKQMRVPPTTIAVPDCSEEIHYNFKYDYEELLSKVEQGTLDILDMLTDHQDQISHETNSEVTQEQIREPQEQIEGPQEQIEGPQTSTEPTDDENIEMTEPDEIPIYVPEYVPEKPYEDQLKAAYENLQRLARKPVRRKSVVAAVECVPKYNDMYDYRSIECKVLEPPFFSYFTKAENLDENNISDHVDLNRCVRLGLIEQSDNRLGTLTEEEKKKVFTLENFENLSLRARYSVMLSHMEELKKQVNYNTSEENSRKDKFGRTPMETLEVFKKLLISLENRIQSVSLIKE